jgi:hypothetical protein
VLPYRTPDWTGLQPGSRIEWRYDHVCSRQRTGVIASHMVGGHGVYAWPDDPNHGPEPRGGVSEVPYEAISSIIEE